LSLIVILRYARHSASLSFAFGVIDRSTIE